MLRTIGFSLLAASVVAVPQLTSTAEAAPAVQTTRVVTFDGLSDLMIQRILLGDDVAASKYFSGKPVDDPVREQQILTSVRASAVQLGIDPDSTAAFFQAQIDASKVVQRGLLSYWAAHPSQAPTTGPDLTVIRQKLDTLTTQLLTELVRVDALRASGLRCAISLAVADATAAAHHHLTHLHREALHAASAGVC
ncbi:gamma subclass chorismate mutase AroQ [Kribbella sp. NPDC026611]|uniref:gamma subclass chorismate mutase AroQ n=1 Tax=Kribbella sp. NPDC026611 TaxID=3154911 RepID=UPI0033EB8D48